MNFITFRDMLQIMLIGFAFLIVVMIQHINPPAKDDDTEPPGNVIAHIIWPAGDKDVDLWVTGPGEIAPVGYSNKSGILWSLLRDDTGDGVDLTSSNFENAYTRGLIPGEYIVNVHCYRCSVVPVPVKVEISVKQDDVNGGNATIREIIKTEVVLQMQKQELTVVRFLLTKEGNVVPGSMNHVFRPLRQKDSTGVPGGLRGREDSPG